MDYTETNHGSKVRVLLTDDELQLSAIDDICDKYIEWLAVSKESKGGRKTRSANRRADILYDEIMAYKLPPIKLKHLSSPISTRSNSIKTLSVDSSIDTDSDSSRPMTRSLRPRSRTPVVQNKPSSRQFTSPSTPQHQRIRSYIKQPTSGSSSNGNSSNVLSAALNQQHPSVSVTKLRQLLRADSAQKKRDEEKERHDRLMLDRKAKEERAEAQKKQLLEERAVNAKLKREQRLLHAAEVRKARQQQKLREQKELEAKKNQPQIPQPTETKSYTVAPTQQFIHNSEELPTTADKKTGSQKDKKQVSKTQDPQPQVQKLNETFKKPSEEINNIDISIQDETTEDQKDKATITAAWARAPHLREALIKQFSKSESGRLQEVLKIFPTVELPVELERIFGPNKAAGTRYLCRTSSAVWSPPHRSIKRTSSMVMTPTNNKY